jgi:hypothetical protein
MEDENLSKTSEFNSAVDYVQRLARLQETLDELRLMNLTDIPFGSSMPVYMLRLKTLTSLWLEILPKSTDEEIEDTKCRKKYTEHFIMSNPLIKINHKGEQIYIPENINKTEILLENLEEALRVIIEKRGLNSPNKLSEGGYD